MLSRPIRVPLLPTQIHESPCRPPVDWMTKCRAVAGGFARSAVGVCAKTSDTTLASATDRSVRYMPDSGELDRRPTGREYCGIHDVDRRAVGERDDLIEHIRELDLVFVARHVADVWRADHVAHLQQRIVRIAKRLLLEHVDRGETRTALPQRRDKRARRNQTRPAGVHQNRSRLHPGQIVGGDETTSLR